MGAIHSTKICDQLDREMWSTSKGGPVFSKLFQLDRTDPLSFGPKFPEILVEWIAPYELTLLTYVSSFLSPEPVVSWSRGRKTRGSGSSRYRMSEKKFLTSGRACAKVTNITAHARNGFLSLTAPLGEKFYFPSSLQRVASLGCFENAPLHSTWIH